MKYLFLLLLILSSSFSVASNFVPIQIVSSASMVGNINSNGVDLQQLNLESISAVYTGAPVGSIKIQVSNDIVPVAPGSNPSANVVNWSDYTGSPSAVSAAGNVTYNLTFAGYRWVRLVYTFTSGTGTLNVYFTGKGN